MGELLCCWCVAIVGVVLCVGVRRIVNGIFLTSFKLVGCKICMVIADAGGNNARLFNLLRKGGHPGDASWITPNIVDFQRPVFPGRKISIWFCSTHCLKTPL